MKGTKPPTFAVGAYSLQVHQSFFSIWSKRSFLVILDTRSVVPELADLEYKAGPDEQAGA